MSWWYNKDGQQAGPVSEAELMTLYEKGNIEDATLVWQSGMGEWVPFAKAWPAEAAARFQAETTQERPRPVWNGIPEDAELSLALALRSAFDFMRTRDAILMAITGLLIYILFVIVTNFIPYYLGVMVFQSITLGVWLTFLIDRLRGDPIGELLKEFSHRQLLPLLFHSLAISGVLILAIAIAAGMTYLSENGSFSEAQIRNFRIEDWASQHPGPASAVLFPWAVMIWGWGMSLPLILDRQLTFSGAMITSMHLAKRFFRPIGGLVLLAAVLFAGYSLLSHAVLKWVEPPGEHQGSAMLLALVLSLAFLYLALWMVVAYIHLYLQLFPLPAPRKVALSDPFTNSRGGEEKR